MKKNLRTIALLICVLMSSSLLVSCAGGGAKDDDVVWDQTQDPVSGDMPEAETEEGEQKENPKEPESDPDTNDEKPDNDSDTEEAENPDDAEPQPLTGVWNNKSCKGSIRSADDGVFVLSDLYSGCFAVCEYNGEKLSLEYDGGVLTGRYDAEADEIYLDGVYGAFSPDSDGTPDYEGVPLTLSGAWNNEYDSDSIAFGDDGTCVMSSESEKLDCGYEFNGTELRLYIGEKTMFDTGSVLIEGRYSDVDKTITLDDGAMQYVYAYDTDGIADFIPEE